MSFNSLLVAPPSFILTYSSQASFSRLVSFLFAGILAFMSHHKLSCSLATTPLQFAGWLLDRSARHLVAPDGVVVSLSGTEYRLLEIFLQNPQRVLSRDELLERTQGRNAVPYDRSIDVQISRLRTRLRDNGREPQLIKTVRGDGYVLATDVRPQFVRPALPVDAPIMPGK